MNRARITLCSTVLTAALFACGGLDDPPGQTDLPDDDGYSTDRLDTPTVVPDHAADADTPLETPEVTVLDIVYPGELPDLPPDPGTDGDVTIKDPGTEEVAPLDCPGGSLCPCEENSDCDTELCIETMTGWQCMVPCLTDISCPKGWKCAVVAGTGGDLVYGCVDPSAQLCKPCKTNQDCGNPYLAGQNICMEFGPHGLFCGTDCDGDGDCPAGFSCEEAASGRAGTLQCRPDAGADCPCNDKHIDKAYLTFCYVENEFGLCLGERTCDVECDSGVPGSETCNGQDDDCNGFTDDGITPTDCPLVNALGTCTGQTVCEAGQEGCEGDYATEEECNGQDDDCDGDTDEFFPDMDQDGLADCVDPDMDDDGYPNDGDNCPEEPNPDQEDCDLDGLGDVCDSDDDDDTVSNTWDNCLCLPNPDQSDMDWDLIGDVCDCDMDGDDWNNPNPDCPEPDPADNCPTVFNPLQEDLDGDQTGDACDPDVDGDNVLNDEDNCPLVYNPDQADLNDDGVGDACDDDQDGDGILDNMDNCVQVPNPDQEDMDIDGAGDACDCDGDDDGVLNDNPGCVDPDPNDNCPLFPNPVQEDCDGDGLGDPCDDDDDNDQVSNVWDNCLCLPNNDQADMDGDQVGDLCDCDMDGDGLDNFNPGCPGPIPPDNCPELSNPGQEDQDGDGTGDVCDEDRDGDGVPNGDDNCPIVFNPDQEDLNANGVGDACDGDPDSDGIKTPDDNCPEVFNPEQEDLDTDGQGNACDCDKDDDGVDNPNPGCPDPSPADNCPLVVNPAQDDTDGDDQGDACDDDDDGDLDPDATDCAPLDPTVFHGQHETCNGKDDECDGLTDEENALDCAPYFYDFDTDDYGVGENNKCLCGPSGQYSAPAAGDCNDYDDTVNPGVTEVCNGKDDNCDGQMNEAGAEGCIVYHQDLDNDGFGTVDESQCLCAPTYPYVTPLGGDCNDMDGQAFPGATESCNDKDDDCDGDTDEENATGCSPLHLDHDDDGFGVDHDKKCLCSETGEYTAPLGDDCDDSDADVNPDADESCNDKDDDCDGDTDEADADGCGPLYFDFDVDGYGVSGNSNCLCGPTGLYSAAVAGDCNDNDAFVNPGTAESCNGKDDDCDSQTDEEDAGGCQDYFQDQDDDGYGTDSDSKCLCAPTTGHPAASGGDCDDQDPGVNPGADEVCNGTDENCNDTVDESFSDLDQDGLADCVDPDMDDDGILNEDDNCPGTPNPGQEDVNVNGIGDACEQDWDGDGVLNALDNCPWVSNEDQGDLDTDQVGDACDCDVDGDGVDNVNPGCPVPDPEDNCPVNANADQADLDQDGPGDACDEDMDGDLDMNETDCAPLDPAIHHGQTETCNDVDDDCDGDTDEEDAQNCTTFFHDYDEDDFGDNGNLKCLCTATGFYQALVGGDCNDFDDAVHPDAQEVCNDVDDDCDAVTDGEDTPGCATFYYDNDSDGFGDSANARCLCDETGKYSAVVGGDCNDASNQVYPDASESCNDKDDDCDGDTDEEDSSGCSTFFADQDQDTWGQNGSTKCLCAASTPYESVKGGDCDDVDAAIHPTANEVCNDKDDDCDGQTDEQNAGGCTPWFYDLDGDGYGSTDNTLCLCEPDGFYTATTGGDCDNYDGTVFPGVPETCNGKDDDCDGSTDEEGASGCTTFYYDNDGDGVGDSADSGCYCAVTGKYSATVGGDCDDANNQLHPQATEACNAKDDDCDDITDEEDAGGCKTYYNDVDQDGYGLAGDHKCLCVGSGTYTAQLVGDCDDGDPDVHDGVPEVCNGKDDDCNGQVDEEGAQDCQAYFYDFDGDDYGISQNAKCLCAASGLYSAPTGGDCNDYDLSVHPGVPEVCNGKDDECDGQTDEEDAAGCSTFYYDNDGDGIGDSADSKCLCAETGKYAVTVGGDCNDYDKSVYPGATEQCNGKDDNCNDAPDEPGSQGCVNFYVDEDDDHYGTFVNECLCQPTGDYTAVQAGDCADDDETVNPGVAETCNNKDDDCNSQTDEDGAYGCTIYYQDVDRDGYGVAYNYVCTCSPTAPYDATVAGDCNDNDDQVKPGTTEACNLKDDDCDGVTDEESATGCTVHLYDGDADGWGSTQTKCLCAPYGKYTADVGGDCNDADLYVNPGTTETCNGKDDDCDDDIDEAGTTGCTEKYLDGDQDGYGLTQYHQCLCTGTGNYTATVGGDCKDDDETVNPGRFEECNTKDDDCDLLVDEEDALGCAAWYYDYDWDTWGSFQSKCLCASSFLYSTQQTGDCDDGTMLIHPGMTEACNGKDDNCNGFVDEEGADGCQWLYQDLDGDGWGTDTTKCLCAQSGFYRALQPGDCNDADSSIYPGALEVCGNGKNDDCDEETDEADCEGCITYYQDADDDGYGLSADSQCLSEPTGNYRATLDSDCDDTKAEINPGVFETCNGSDDDCDGSTDEEGADGCALFYSDGDSDTWGTESYRCLCAANGDFKAPQAGDCDDTDENVNPDAVEACNAVDDDCNHATDEAGATGCTTYNNDSDSDGYGAEGDTRCLCTAAVPYTAGQAGDCNDNDKDINPDAPEVCNGKDDDCDGVTDPEDGLGCGILFLDGDGDTYGLTGDTRCVCAGTGQYTATEGSDCDDGDPLVFPGATESCNGSDDDCDAEVDEEDSLGCTLFHFDNDGDDWGTSSVQSRCLCAADPPFDATQLGDCNDSNGDVNPDGVEACNWIDDDCDGATDEENGTGCTTYHLDGDGDGYGLEGQTKCLCAPTGDYDALGAGDCNDLEADIHPNTAEVCNNLDDDCDNLTDEGGSTGCTVFYSDGDGDGWGTTESQCLCGAQAPFTATSSGDCDDVDPDVNPAEPEACNDKDDDCNGETDEVNAVGCQNYYRDVDLDGYGTALFLCLCSPAAPYSAPVVGDCDDSVAAVNPGVGEECNLADDDCDGLTDEENATGCTTFFYDNDMDGHGVTGNTKCLCGAEGRYTASVGGDCNDNDGEIHLGSGETCNGKDDDCDGEIDEEGAIGCLNRFLDSDGDTFGVNGETRCLCQNTGNYSADQGQDCDDGDAFVHPDATEVCNGKDDNCDTLTDPEDADGCTTWYIDLDQDGWGTPQTRCLCVAALPYNATVIGDCNDNAADVAPDATESCNGKDDDCDNVVDEENSVGCTTYFHDGDGDGFGMASNSRCLCTPADSYTALVAGDCNDGDYTVFPGQSETCNGKDDDCDAVVDGEDTGGCQVFLKDGDSDWFGVTGDSKCICWAAGDYTATVGGDCDDGDDAVNTNATEVCANGKDDDCNGQTDESGCGGCITYYLDVDDDTWGVSGESQCLSAPSGDYSATRGDDCDDGDGTVNPGMTETCNGKDDDCDGTSEGENSAGCTTYHYDYDSDGYGVPGNSRCLCAPGDKYTAGIIGDCNDIDSSVNPAGNEICNGKDDDCNGVEDDVGSLGCTTRYFDNDGDGFGLTSDSQCLCGPSGKYTASVGSDCNDNDATVNPVATELCLNGKDDDCDGETDGTGCQGCTTYYLDEDGDTWGVTGDTECLGQATGLYRATRGDDCDDVDAGVNPGMPESCNDKDDDCNGITDGENAVGCDPFYYDFDGDTYGVTGFIKCLCAATGKYTAGVGGDCNDNDPNVLPGQTETCNNKDDDCDGETDEENAEGCQTWFFDSDQDTFGSSGNTRCLCIPWGLYTASLGGDCEDADPTVNPVATEACNGKDDDCDGEVDPEGAFGCALFNYDFDGDAWGTSQTKCLCEATGDYEAQNSGDCDDTDGTIYPGAPESCNGKDDDCDSQVDEQAPIGCTYFYLDGDQDDYGVSADSLCLCQAEGDYTADEGGDCDDTSAAINPTQVEACNGLDDDCDSQTDEADDEAMCGTVQNGEPLCTGGTCTSLCDGGFHDIDGVEGCECQQDTNDGTGNQCAAAINLGILSDGGTGSKTTVSGRIIPDDDVDWYEFSATDSTDTGTFAVPGHDNFHVRVLVTSPADGTILANVYKGTCTQALTCTTGSHNARDVQWYMNFADTDDQTGQDPCVSAPSWECCRTGECSVGESAQTCCGGNGNDNPVQCTDSSKNKRNCVNDVSTFFVKVYRAAGEAVVCADTEYSLEISNGQYPAP